ncbi:MAG: hypothetical protein JSV29_00205, partial [Candidatus Bathyarchaeota archaeon]
MFNMGLVFNNPEVSQDADAADAYRRALTLRPDYGPAKERLDDTRGKLVPLAEHALVATTGLIQSDDLFRFYISPFEALQIGLVEELDVKVIQRAKKRLLQEIELNDGKVSWLDNCSLDKNRTLMMEDELFDEKKRRYHWAVFQNKRLLGFLTRGDIRHFLYSDDYFPLDTLELLDEEPEFRTFLSKPFSRQYNLVLTRAIERRLLPVVEVLFDGRRWIDPEDEDICFEGAFKRIGELVELMRSRAAEGCTRKVSLQEIEDFLQQHSFPELFNLLPTNFAHAQRGVVEAIRSLAYSCFKEHHDADLANGILSLCKRFRFRSIKLAKDLGEDFQALEQIIAHESRLPTLSGIMEEEHEPTEEMVPELRGNQEASKKSSVVGWLVFIAATITTIIVVVVINQYSNPRQTGPRGDSHAPLSGSSASNAESKTAYRVPSHISAELARDNQAIENEKAKAKEMASRLESLSAEIERARLFVGPRSLAEADEFNR